MRTSGERQRRPTAAGTAVGFLEPEKRNGRGIFGDACCSGRHLERAANESAPTDGIPSIALPRPADGKVVVVWQSAQGDAGQCPDGHLDASVERVFAWGDPILQVSDSPANDWEPHVARRRRRGDPYSLGRLPRRQLRHLLSVTTRTAVRSEMWSRSPAVREIPSPRECCCRSRGHPVAGMGRVRRKLGQGSGLPDHAAAGSSVAPGTLDPDRQAHRRDSWSEPKAELEPFYVYRLYPNFENPQLAFDRERHSHDAVPSLDAAAGSQHRLQDDVGDVPDALRRKGMDRYPSPRSNSQGSIEKRPSIAMRRRLVDRGLDDGQPDCSPTLFRRTPKSTSPTSARTGAPPDYSEGNFTEVRRALRRSRSDPSLRGTERRDDSRLHHRRRGQAIQDLPRGHAPPHRRLAGLQVRRVPDRGLPIRNRCSGV